MQATEHNKIYWGNGENYSERSIVIAQPDETFRSL